MQKISQEELRKLAEKYGYAYAGVRAVVMVESSGSGYDPATGKIMIQFEPSWYRKLDAENGFSGDGVWEQNKVERQAGEWLAFNNAFSLDPDAAMQATSIGMMQVMGFHYKELGFATPGAMWDFAKESEANQVEIGLMFIKKSTRLDAALKSLNWKTFAYYYNGPKYQTNNYDVRLANEYAEALG